MMRHCPADSALIALFMNEAPRRMKEKLLRHLAVCSRCTLRFSVLRQAKRELQPQVDSFAAAFSADEGAACLQDAARRKILELEPGPPRGHSPSSPFGVLLGLRAAAGLMAVLMVLTLAGYLLLTGLQRRAETRSPSAKLALLAPSGRLSAAPAEFRWTPVLNAEGYAIEIVDDTLTKIGRVSVFFINEVEIPPEIRSRLVKGRTYVWTVVAVDGDGNSLTSRSASFLVD